MDTSIPGYQPNSRRQFIEKSIRLAIVGGIGGLSLFSGCKDKDDDGDGQKVSPPEDLMQEHGLLNRVLLIYDNCRQHLSNKESFQRQALVDGAGVIRIFVEDYHEKQEENYLFPRFRKANQLTELVDTLLKQHNAGRALTDKIAQLAKVTNPTDSDSEQLLKALNDFNYMYRPHEAREDTILFPAFRKIVSKHEYDALGEEFENNEQKLFGKGGFETMVDRVATIEKALGIYDLEQFTPKL